MEQTIASVGGCASSLLRLQLIRETLSSRQRPRADADVERERPATLRVQTSRARGSPWRVARGARWSARSTPRLADPPSPPPPAEGISALARQRLASWTTRSSSAFSSERRHCVSIAAFGLVVSSPPSCTPPPCTATMVTLPLARTDCPGARPTGSALPAETCARIRVSPEPGTLTKTDPLLLARSDPDGDRDRVTEMRGRRCGSRGAASDEP